MFKKIIDGLGLLGLGFRLILSLLIFSFEFCWTKFRLERYLIPALILCLVVINLLNWQIWQLKSRPKIVLAPAVSQNQGEELLEFDQAEWLALKSNYLLFIQQQSNSRDLNYNFAKILETEGQEMAAELFFSASQLDPNYP